MDRHAGGCLCGNVRFVATGRPDRELDRPPRALAAQAAERFWTAARTEKFAAPLSRAMRTLAAKNVAAARAFVAPLGPAA